MYCFLCLYVHVYIQVSETDLATPTEVTPSASHSNPDMLSSLPELSQKSESDLNSQQLEIVQASKAILDTVRMRDFPAYK